MNTDLNELICLYSSGFGFYRDKAFFVTDGERTISLEEQQDACIEGIIAFLK